MLESNYDERGKRVKTRTVLEKAIAAYGEDNQVFKAIEELGELITELGRNSMGESNIPNIAEEIADVQIMCSQLELIFNIEAEVQAQREYKIKRLYKRLKEPELIDTEDIIEKDGKKYKHVCDDKSCRLMNKYAEDYLNGDFEKSDVKEYRNDALKGLFDECKV